MHRELARRPGRAVINVEPERSGLRQQAARGLAWTVLQRAFTRFASLLTFVLLSRLLTPAEFGLVAAAALVVEMCGVFFQLGTRTYLVQAVALRPGAVDTAFWTGLALSCVLGGLVAAVAGRAEALLDMSGLRPVLLALALAAPLSALSTVPAALMSRGLAFDRLAKRNMIGMVAAAAVGIGLALAGFGVWALVAQTYAQNLSSVVLLYGVAGWRPRLRWERAELAEILRYTARVWPIQALTFIRGRADEVLVAALLGPALLGAYAVAKRILVVVVDLFSSVVMEVLLPVLAAAKQQPERVQRGYVMALGTCAALVVPAACVLAAVSPWLVPVVFGEQWATAGHIAQVSALGLLPLVAAFVDRAYLLAVDRPSAETGNLVVAAVLSTAAAVIAAPHGVVPMAAAGLIALYLSWSFRVATVVRLSDVGSRRLATAVLPAVLAAVTSAAVPTAVYVGLHRVTATEVWHAAGLLLVALLLYPVVLRRLCPSSAGHIAAVLQPIASAVPAVRAVTAWLMAPSRRTAET